MKILAIDTSTEACSAALHINGDVTEHYAEAPRQHAELILPMVDQLFTEAGVRVSDMDALAFGRGPGAFTGVRVATGVIQGLAFAADLAVVPVSTLASLAQGAVEKSDHLFSAIDARMGEIYYGLFKSNEKKLVVPVMEESVCKPEQINVPDNGKWYGVGSAWLTYREILEKKLTGKLIAYKGKRYPRARDIIPLAIAEIERGNTTSADKVLPVYLRNQVVS